MVVFYHYHPSKKQNELFKYDQMTYNYSQNLLIDTNNQNDEVVKSKINVEM